MLFNKLATALSLLTLVAAHPGHDVAQEAAERREYLQSVKRTSLAHCAEELKAQGIHARNIARRQAVVEKAREKRGLKTRSFSSVLATDHNKSGLGYSRNTDAATLFAGYKSCLLTPEVTQGPYYVAGEYVRENVVEDQPGVSLLLDYQVINVATCKPVPDVYVEIWHCNSTGVYGGIIANGNGNSADKSNSQKSWLRGIQPTDSDGVAQFQSVFPGHYTGRTTHIHVMVHTKATVLANNTLGFTNYASHIGQTFFDQTLITAVEKVAPYSTNKQQLTTNAADMIMSQEAGTEGVDPVMEYTLLGSTVADGLYAWIAFGIDASRSQAINPAGYLYQQSSSSSRRTTTSMSSSARTSSSTSSVRTTTTTTARTSTTTTAAAACQTAAGGAALWAQCGGIGYAGSTACASGKCTYYNDYYSQCIPC